MAPVGELAHQVVEMAEGITKEAINLATGRHPPPQRKWKTLVAGATAGLVVDTALYPVDTIKSRLQSKAGFRKSGGFKHLYRGLPPVLAGSIPNGKLRNNDLLYSKRHTGNHGYINTKSNNSYPNTS